MSGNTTINVASSASNASDNLVLRDGSGDFAANEITSDLVGNLTGATSTAKDLNPAADSTYDLGTNTVRWQTVFADTVNATTYVGSLTGTSSDAAAITVADESADTSCNVVFVTAATGSLAPKTGTNLTFNSSTGNLAATTFTGLVVGDVTGDLTAVSYTHLTLPTKA